MIYRMKRTLRKADKVKVNPLSTKKKKKIQTYTCIQLIHPPMWLAGQLSGIMLPFTSHTWDIWWSGTDLTHLKLCSPYHKIGLSINFRQASSALLKRSPPPPTNAHPRSSAYSPTHTQGTLLSRLSTKYTEYSCPYMHTHPPTTDREVEVRSYGPAWASLVNTTICSIHFVSAMQYSLSLN